MNIFLTRFSVFYDTFTFLLFILNCHTLQKAIAAKCMPLAIAVDHGRCQLSGKFGVGFTSCSYYFTRIIMQNLFLYNFCVPFPSTKSYNNTCKFFLVVIKTETYGALHKSAKQKILIAYTHLIHFDII